MIGKLGFSQDDYGAAQTQGARDYQEDDYGVHIGVDVTDASAKATDDILLVLADGMGGESAGDVASGLVVKTLMNSFENDDGQLPPERLERALQQANMALSRAVADEPQLKGMGCTVVALHIAVGKAHWISVGDSLLWHFRDGRLTRLNEDHSYGAVLDQLAELGRISPEKAANSKDRNVLTSAVNGDRIEKISLSDHPLAIREGDLFVLASDGLLTLDDERVSQVLDGQAQPEDIARRLIAAVTSANEPGQDNASCQVLRCRRHHRVASRRVAREPMPTWRFALLGALLCAVTYLAVWWHGDGRNAAVNADPFYWIGESLSSGPSEKPVKRCTTDNPPGWCSKSDPSDSDSEVEDEAISDEKQKGTATDGAGAEEEQDTFDGAPDPSAPAVETKELPSDEPSKPADPKTDGNPILVENPTGEPKSEAEGAEPEANQAGAPGSVPNRKSSAAPAPRQYPLYPGCYVVDPRTGSFYCP